MQGPTVIVYQISNRTLHNFPQNNKLHVFNSGAKFENLYDLLIGTCDTHTKKE